MRAEFESILKKIILWKKSKNVRIYKKAEKIESYLKDCEAGDITEGELKKLLDRQVKIDQMNESSDEMELTKQINEAIHTVSNILK